MQVSLMHWSVYGIALSRKTPQQVQGVFKRGFISDENVPTFSSKEELEFWANAFQNYSFFQENLNPLCKYIWRKKNQSEWSD